MALRGDEQAAPVAPAERIQVVDILRGFAIFGILVVNMGFFAGPLLEAAAGFPSWSSPADRIASTLIRFLATGKFFTLFSTLFGLGLAIQMQRAEAKGVPIVPLYVRRLLVLLVIGIAHATLLWYGDILAYYALLGFVLLLFRNADPRTLLRWAAILIALPILLNLAFFGLAQLAGNSPEAAAQAAPTAEFFAGRNEQELEAYSSFGFFELIPQRLADYGITTFAQIFGGGLFTVLAMFLVGLYIGKRGIVQDIPGHLGLLRRVFIGGALIGLVGETLAMTLDTGNLFQMDAARAVASAGHLIGAPALSLCYASGILLLTRDARWHARLAPLAAVGRTALSNYLLQTLICTTLFYGYGLGWFGRVGPALGFLITLVIFALQIPLSMWWLRRFRFGPFEWLWRTFTYGAVQPLRHPVPEDTRAVS